VLVAYVRTVKTGSGAIAVQIVYSNRRGSREIEHIGSAHAPAEVEVLKTVARQRMHANQDTLDLDDGRLGDAEAPIVSSQARHLWEVLAPPTRWWAWIGRAGATRCSSCWRWPG
jgi:hypothetical protein